ncbi:hypothetical protein SAMN05216319_3633 [Duganella sp. CF402]|uniref:hypothetical protein n=1 Tax=unclassified Duganella TaxID=2636909 RepID=UPI0008B0B782|nr:MULTISPECIES: hypothetical protein [unclassified Duganella]RZT04580.1 hypothetical protein EV582_5472 [Duganella sp. BK701]SEM31394.1 hypothetical protein SAMN05216319_3633 [Duganella sp. CF402]
MPTLPAIARRQRGAALLLLILMLGLGVSVALMSTRPGDDSVRQRQSMQLVAEAREALLGFAMTHGRLPRPAISAQDGREMTTPCNRDSCTGFLPWVTLGVVGSDSWGKLLRYSVSPSFAAQRIDPTQARADKKIASRREDGELYYLVGDDSCSVQARCAPAVVFSSGKNNLGTSAQGIPLANGTINNVDEEQNNGDTTAYIARRLETRSQAPGGEFDDIVTWVPVQTFYRRIEISGVLDPTASAKMVPSPKSEQR